MPTTYRILQTLPLAWRLGRPAVLTLAFAGSIMGCSMDRLLQAGRLPADVRDPNAFRTREGAFGTYNQALVAFTQAVGGAGGLSGSRTMSHANASGLLTDEIQYIVAATAAYPVNAASYVDNRSVPEDDMSAAGLTLSGNIHDPFIKLNDARIAAREAANSLAKYAPDAPAALRGHAYALEAFAQVLLAELYCSGIPLTTLDFETGFTPTRGFSTEEVLRKSLRLLDTALALSADSARISHLVNVVRGRTYLNLGLYDSAAIAASSVPIDFTYTLRYIGASLQQYFTFAPRGASLNAWDVRTMGDRKGGNGLPYVSSGDPRTRARRMSSTVTFPQKFDGVGAGVLIVASGVEAQLIIAEAELAKGNVGTFLDILNALRTTGTFATQPQPGNPTAVDTTWDVGSGAALFVGHTPALAGLRLLTDPGIPAERVSLLFEERGYWLYLTGHRQGDLRRLVRQYKRREDQVYPTGRWGPLALTSYGTDVNLPVPAQEQLTNTLYTGCINRDA